jgi:hypothetical protein
MDVFSNEMGNAHSEALDRLENVTVVTLAVVLATAVALTVVIWCIRLAM